MAETNENAPVTRAYLEAALEAQTQRFTAKLTSDLETALQEQAQKLTEAMRQIETNLLTGFYGYQRNQSGRLAGLETSDRAIADRLTALEERVLVLETHRPY